MEVFTSVKSLRNFLDQQLLQQRTVGLVPTMGALHDGHISLIERAIQQTDIVVCSIFVNPTQFNNPEDLLKYPRTPEEDYAMLEKAGCSAVFAPSVEEMYPEAPLLTINFGTLETVMEGASRPGHFNGVGIVVSRLFNIVRPHKAYFGQKDLQQVSIIRRLITDLAFDLELVVCPTIRELDGLAMSSRNRRLDANERNLAPAIYKILTSAKENLLAGKQADDVIELAKSKLLVITEMTLDYIEIVNLKTLQSIGQIGPKGSNAVCIAVFLGPVRLIDNIVF